MTEVVLDDRLLVAVLGAIASLGVGLLANRREIARMQDRLWGPERGADEGLEEGVASLEADHRRLERRVDALATAFDRLEDDRADTGPVSASRPAPEDNRRVAGQAAVRFPADEID